MLFLLRNTRRKLMQNLPAGKAGNKITTYMLYALGEVGLVVIGILIAVQIDDWNEQQKLGKERRIILENLLQDLNEDVRGFEESIQFLNRRKQHVDTLLTLWETDFNPVDHALIAHWLITSGYILDYTPVFPTYNEVLSSGRLNVIASDTIIKILATYQSRVENNLRITSTYDTELKQIESKATTYCSKTPISQHFISDPYVVNAGVVINIDDLKKDEELRRLLKHNSYYTQVEVVMKAFDFLPLIESLQQLIEAELTQY